MCPHHCGVDRTGNDGCGFCRTGRYAFVNSYMAHYGEEAPLRGTNGSGTIFIAHCNMGCVFCQNWEISSNGDGVKVVPEDIAAAMLSLQVQGCHNINLVTPSHIIPQFLSALLIAAGNGLRLPIVYNSGGYDSITSLKLLEGVIDIYMPDMKYGDSETGFHLSKVKDYVKVNQDAVLEMHRQVGDLKLDENGIAHSGLIVRHLMLPGMMDETEKILRYISEKISPNTYLNLMDQYRPLYQAGQYTFINRRLSRDAYLGARKKAEQFGLLRFDK